MRLFFRLRGERLESEDIAQRGERACGRFCFRLRFRFRLRAAS
ncbi:hypothetical protein [Polyangium sorediatum]|uniref:Uncharacterized protein n=1 Tax=Polyangium sorediatum TaxID=889274 RepID=A0ABT6P6Z9_9BACT|nr:hypothetical protein [Polyangium sorediatum]MDI1436082.1 hypothetical protein [Polyangium sorediatum]